MTPSATAQPTVAQALEIIAAENAVAVRGLDAANGGALDDAARVIRDANRVFLLGAGRSGIALQFTAMRLMHLGLAVHVVGEVTAPAIGEGDVLLVASGSGSTAGIVRAAQTATDVKASVVAITADAASAVSKLATVTLLVEAARKLDRDSTVTAQYAGSLFEQTVVTIGDALFHSLWLDSGQTADELWPRHSNLE
ncbi:6-phospho-3-hexuloisomerase [Conyzicola lurida]|uniref:6-phospho-3-hexuloisomerase n=1 Tax=Conyzicola lurida TaxID=1172621 RepID=A0A841AP09_9MICO|nr:6-phospho-3-hexuloisomerase [Conyzicola lurida]MBB5844058.1 6-phospho-3-hexuloisomerase [Conyzicola lurida]